MSNKKLQYATKVFERLLEVTESSNFEELANYLGINYGTLRNQKRRGTIPYEEIVSKCDDGDVIYVLKGYNIGDPLAIKRLPIEDLKRIDMMELESLRDQVALLRQRVENLKSPPSVRDGNKFKLLPVAYTDEHYITSLENHIQILNSKIKALEEELSKNNL